MKNKSINVLLKSILNTVLIWIANVLIIIAMAYICQDFILGPCYNAIIIATLVAITNIVLWPILVRLFMPILIYSFGFGALILNDFIFYFCAIYLPGVSVGLNGFLQVPLAMAIVTTLVSNIVHFDFYNTYIKSISKQAKKMKKNHVKKYSGLIMLEIDGLAEKILKEAIDNGSMPTLKKWLENGNYTIKQWETDLSSQTSASQAGILHGNNKDIVAFRWVNKNKDHEIVVSSNFKQLNEIEKKISDGNGLLVENGASRANMFSGDTDNVIFTSSKFRNLKKMYNNSWYAVFSSAYNFQRIFVMFLWEILIELKSQIMHKVKNIQPRLKRGLIYASTRAGANVFLREITTETLIGDILIGDIDAAYATYVGYDEVAHHSGIRDEDVWNVLKMIDLQFNRLEKAVQISDRNYELVILSDHGQGNGYTFKQRYGISFPMFVRSLLPEDMEIYSEMDSNKDHLQNPYTSTEETFDAFVEHIKASPLYDNETINNLREKYIEQKENLKNSDLNPKKPYEDTIKYLNNYKTKKHKAKKPEASELIVLGSGNLALIYFTQWKYRLSYEEIVLNFPDLIAGIVKHSGIGFIVVDSLEKGPMVIGSDGVYYLDSDEIEGENPLEDFGENAAEHIKRHNTFKDMPDILVNSFYNPETEEIAAFEELIGSHGGLGGTQTKPFIMYPSYWKVPKELKGAHSIYELLKKQMKRLKEE